MMSSGRISASGMYFLIHVNCNVFAYEGQDCQRKATHGKCCVFPFTYKGKNYTDCTKVGHKHSWCSTTPNYDKDRKWGTCQDCRRKTTENACCVFPFTYKGKLHSHCTKLNHNREWCSTTSNYDQDGLWGNCYGYDSCDTALSENCNKEEQYPIHIKGTSRFVTVTCKIVQSSAVAFFHYESNKRTFVKGYEDPGSYRRVLRYNSNISDIGMFIKQARSCRQFTRVECNHAMLDNHAWLEDRNGNKLPYWGGGPENGTGRGCACGMSDACYVNTTKCNCDANVNRPLKDEGYVRNKHILPITAVSFSDTGHTPEWIYYTIGSVECVFPPTKKQDLVPPRVRFEPSDLIDEDRHLKITCLSDICSSNYVWFKDSRRLLPSKETIELPFVTRKEAGLYSCTINTPLGISGRVKPSKLTVKYSLNSGANSEPQRLHWLIEFELQGIVTFDGISVTKLQERIHCQFGSDLDSPKVTVSPSTFIKEQTNVNLTCKSEGQPTLSYVWKKNGYLPVSPSEQLNIFNISRDSTGDYVCVVSNGIKEKYSRPIRLFVQYLDTPVLLPSTSQSVHLGERITMLCRVSSYPTSAVRWFHNNQTLSSKNSVLRIEKVTKDHIGEYTCSARNSVGHKISSPTTIRLLDSNMLYSPLTSRQKKIKQGEKTRSPYFYAFIVCLLISLLLAGFILWGKCRKHPIRNTSNLTSNENATFKYSELNSNQGNHE